MSFHPKLRLNACRIAGLHSTSSSRGLGFRALALVLLVIAIAIAAAVEVVVVLVDVAASITAKVIIKKAVVPVIMIIRVWDLGLTVPSLDWLRAEGLGFR